MKLILKATVPNMDEVDRQIKLFREIQEELNFRSIWSEFNATHSREDFNKIAFQGTFDVIYKDFWRKSGQGPLQPIPVTNPTWMDLWIAAEQLINASGDTHHVFVEQFKPGAGATLRLITGS